MEPGPVPEPVEPEPVEPEHFVPGRRHDEARSRQRGERRFDALSLLTGVVALIGAALYALDSMAEANVDELVVVASLWIGLAAVGLVRSAIGLIKRLRGPLPSR